MYELFHVVCIGPTNFDWFPSWHVSAILLRNLSVSPRCFAKLHLRPARLPDLHWAQLAIAGIAPCNITDLASVVRMALLFSNSSFCHRLTIDIRVVDTAQE